MYLFFDTETTGLPKNWNASVSQTDNWPRLVQLALLTYHDDGTLEREANFIIKPEGFIVPKEASDIHGITHDRAMKDGWPLPFVLGAFWYTIMQSKALVAHNYQYDYSVMGAEYLRVMGENPLAGKPSICTKEVSTDYCKLPGRYGYKWPKLQELYFKLFEKDFEGAHDAMNDILATAECFWEMKKRSLISKP